MAEQAPEYSAPAVDKALDVLEALADAGAGLSQLDIAKAVGRTPAQIFRVLLRLERRGYVHRDAEAGLYRLSLRLFDLAHRHDPLRSLSIAAAAPLRRLAEEIRQSVNLGILDDEAVRVIAQAETPADFGFRTRVGAVFPLATTTGQVLAAFTPRAAHLIDDENAQRIRADGHLVRADPAHAAITDVVFPILSAGGREAVAALTVPLVDSPFSVVPLTTVRERAAVAARDISAALGV